MSGRNGTDRKTPAWQCFGAVGLLFAFAFALALAVSPQLHERLHPEAGQSPHECAVTLIAAGKVQQAAAAPLVAAPQPVALFLTLPALNPIRVPAQFLGACIFEHAPPALS
ncbi:MAG: hypothetical protein ACR2ID_09170 [Chthoniobacterales bacterium]